MQASNPKGIIGFLIGMLMNFIHTKFYMSFINSLYLKKNAKILDIGCGGGKLVNKLSKCSSSSKIIGIDQSLEMVKLSKKVNRTEIEDRKVEIIKAALPVLSFENNHFDFITACETIQFWPELEKSIAEVKRVLSSKGVFMIINRFPSQKSKWYKLVQIKNDNQYCSLLKHAGFNEIDIKHKNGWIIIKAQ